MQRIRVAPLERWEDNRLVRIHNGGFRDHILSYGQFSGLRTVCLDDVRGWRESEFFDSEGLLKAEVDGIVGYAFAKVDQVFNEKGESFFSGYLKNMGDSCSLLCVLPAWRRRNIGTTLLQKCEAFIRSRGLTFIVAWVYQSDIIAQEFLKRAGYRHHENFFVKEFSQVLPLNADIEFWKKNLTKPIISREIALPKGYLAREYQEGDEVNYVKVHNSVWGQYGQIITVDDVKRTLRDARRNKVLFMETKGEVVGSAYFNHDGTVNLDGVVPEHRGKGVGALLLAKTFECMQRQGYIAAYMSTSIVLKGALTLYKKLECTFLDRLLCMVKTLV